jgi:hypothetical protein
MVLKMARVPLENTYFCKNYFRDVRYNPINNWVCRAMEKAADMGLISRFNLFAEPEKHISRIEALAIVLNG